MENTFCTTNMGITKLTLLWCLFLTCFSIGKAQITCSNGVLVYQRLPSTSVRLDARADRTIEVASTEVPTSACQRVCDGTPSCRSFSIDYTTRTCKVFSDSVLQSRLIGRPGSSFFEKICLPDVSEGRIRSMCGSRMWAVERVRGAAFNGFVARLQENVPSREVCIRTCLGETAFECASATYDEITRTCSLSAEDRHTQPSAISDNSKSSDYFENECITNLRDCQFLPQNNIRVVSIDYITVARSENECREDCNKNTALICRSYSFDISKNSCSLSSDNSVSLLGADLPTEDGFRYAERRCRHFSPNAQFPVSPQALALAGGTGNTIGFSGGSFHGLPSTTNTNVFPNSGGFPFGSSIPQSSAPGFNNFGFGSGGGSGFSPQSNSFQPGGTAFVNANNPFFNGQNDGVNFGRRIPSNTNDPRLFGNPFSGAPNTIGGGGYFPVSDGCTLEKTAGITVISEPSGIIPTSSFGRGITIECAAWCRIQGLTRCPAFTVDYATNQCTVLNRPAETAVANQGTPTQSYFEKVCFNTIYRSCEGKAWAFQRFVNTELRGFDDRVLPSVTNRRDCEEACLKETQFLCMSAEYDSNRFECRLSRESRITRSYALQQSPNIDYLENQCAPNTPTRVCNPARQEGLALLYVDTSFPQVYTEDECRRICQTFPNFTCVAASYSQTNHDCLLSGDATVFQQPDSVLLYSSCLQPNQVSPPAFGTTGHLIPGINLGNQFPASFGSNNFGRGLGSNPQGSFIPSQFAGNANPFLNTGNHQNPFLTTTLSFPNQNPNAFGTGTSTFSNQNPNGFGTGISTFSNQNPQLFGTGSSAFPQQTPHVFGSSAFPQQTPQLFGSSAFPQQNPQLFGSSAFPQQNPHVFGSSGFPQSFVGIGTSFSNQNPQGFGTSSFPQQNPQFIPITGSSPSTNTVQGFTPGQFSSFNPGGTQQFSGSGIGQQFPSSSSGFSSPFPNNALNTNIRSQGTRNPTTTSNVNQRTIPELSGISKETTKRDDDDVEVEATKRKPIRDVPQFLRAGIKQAPLPY